MIFLLSVTHSTLQVIRITILDKAGYVYPVLTYVVQTGGNDKY